MTHFIIILKTCEERTRLSFEMKNTQKPVARVLNPFD